MTLCQTVVGHKVIQYYVIDQAQLVHDLLRHTVLAVRQQISEMIAWYSAIDETGSRVKHQL